MAGLLGVEKQTRKRAIEGLKDVSEMEQQRELANRANKTAETNQNMSMTASGAMMGAMAFGPIGAVGGAAAGFLTSNIF